MIHIKGVAKCSQFSNNDGKRRKHETTASKTLAKNTETLIETQSVMDKLVLVIKKRSVTSEDISAQ